MAYQAVDADDRMEEGDAGLQFKSFLGQGTTANGNSSNQSSRNAPGYFQDSAPKGSGGFWTVEYYQKYFDVDTSTVIKRCYTTLMPWSTEYLTVHTTPSPDLYGPFWTLTTVIFSLYVFSSFTASLVNYLSPTATEPFQYNFTNLSVAVTLVYAYGLGVPALLWLFLRWLGVGPDEWTLVEALASWGYGMFVWIPVSLLCIAPWWFVRWGLVGIAFFVSGYFLWSNVYPIIATTPQKSTRLLLPGLIILHASVAMTFKILFFSYYIADIDGSSKDPFPGSDGVASTISPSPTTEGAVLETTAAMAMRMFL